jgi:hypothetical protein
MRLKSRAIAAGFELLRVHTVFVRVILHDAREELLRKPTNRLPIRHIRGNKQPNRSESDEKVYMQAVSAAFHSEMRRPSFPKKKRY